MRNEFDKNNYENPDTPGNNQKPPVCFRPRMQNDKAAFVRRVFAYNLYFGRILGDPEFLFSQKFYI